MRIDFEVSKSGIFYDFRFADDTDLSVSMAKGPMPEATPGSEKKRQWDSVEGPNIRYGDQGEGAS